ncbi:MAG: hypothetical protein ACR2PT_07000, partial [Endozoicomonas sp.]
MNDGDHQQLLSLLRTQDYLGSLSRKLLRLVISHLHDWPTNSAVEILHELQQKGCKPDVDIIFRLKDKRPEVIKRLLDLITRNLGEACPRATLMVDLAHMH